MIDERAARRLGQLLGLPIEGLYLELVEAGPAGWWVRLAGQGSFRLGTSGSLRRPREVVEHLAAAGRPTDEPLTWGRLRHARLLLEQLERDASVPRRGVVR